LPLFFGVLHTPSNGVGEQALSMLTGDFDGGILALSENLAVSRGIGESKKFPASGQADFDVCSLVGR
jgi:hypothetical protein